MENSKLDKYINECEGDVNKAISLLVDEYVNSILNMAVENNPVELPFFIAAMDIARCIIDEKLNSIQKKQVEDITSLFPVLNIKVDKAEIMRQINEIRKKKDEDTDG